MVKIRGASVSPTSLRGCADVGVREMRGCRQSFRALDVSHRGVECDCTIGVNAGRVTGGDWSTCVSEQCFTVLASSGRVTRRPLAMSRVSRRLWAVRVGGTWRAAIMAVASRVEKRAVMRTRAVAW